MRIPKLIAAVLLPCIGLVAALPAQALLSITSATWDGKKLTIQGTDGKGGDVGVFYTDYAADGTPEIGEPLGTASVKGSGNWRLQINSNRNNPLVPVPCAVSATLTGDPTVENVTVVGAPADCAPQPPAQQACNIDVAPITLAFGDVTEGTTATLTTTVSNSGTVACGVTITQTGSTDFAADPLGFSVAPAGSQVVSVDYTPSAVGADAGNLAVDSNDPDTPSVDVALSGNGIPVQVDNCDIVVNPVAIIFGDVQIGTTSSLSTTVSNIGAAACSVTITQTGSIDFVAAPLSFDVAPTGSQVVTVDFTPTALDSIVGNLAVGSNDPDTANVDVSLAGNGVDQAGNAAPTARGDAYATPVGKPLNVVASRLSGVLYNDFDADGDVIEIVSNTTTANGTLLFNTADGSFTYTPDLLPNGDPVLGDNANDSFTYTISDGTDTATATVNINILSDQPDFKIMMNYELGMHCTGFEFSYCCVLPPYNSILAQVVRSESDSGDFPRLLEGDPNVGRDGLGRETVVRDFDTGGTFNKYQLRYSHDAQPRREGQGKPQATTLISDIEGNSMQYFASIYDSAQVDVDGSITGVVGKLVTGTYNGSTGVVIGDDCPDGSSVGCTLNDPTDNYANGWLNHFYIYADLEGHLNGSCTPLPADPANRTRCSADTDCAGGEICDFSIEQDKIRLGVAGNVEYPANSGAALQPMGPIGAAGTDAAGDPCTTTVPNDPNCTPNFDNVLTFSADTGTVVYTQSKVLENLPIMLTSPRIWEALGMPLTPFEDTIDFFANPGAVDEDSVRPFVAMKAQLHEYPSGNAVLGSNNHPVIGFGTAPIDIPNCERCHAVDAIDVDTNTPNVNSPNYVRRPVSDGGTGFDWPFGALDLQALTDLEYGFWFAYYGLTAVDSDWYPRLKSAAINMLALHDADKGTAFTRNFPACDIMTCPQPPTLPTDPLAQNTRLGHESVICQKCHADNVIAVVKSTTNGTTGGLIPPISEAIHNTHRNTTENDADGNPGVIVFNDSFGRDGGCQGCHPAHRSDGVMDGYPIDERGNNAQALADNRTGAGGCFVGRDVHSNPMKDTDGAGTPSYMNAVGQWLVDNVVDEAGDTEWRGIWCTNCHTQLGQEMWAAEDCNSLIHNDCVNNVRDGATLADVAAAVGLTPAEAESMLDPKTTNPVDDTHRIWDPTVSDADVATIEVDGAGNPVVTADADGDISVNILSFCTTDDCVVTINGNKGNENAWRYPEGGNVDGTAGFIDPANNSGAAVPFSAATDGRDHWLSAGEPHCADCHQAPFVESSGNITPFPPFNYPAKASLMRYSRGHQDVSCQGCHESIHGLYPVTPTIDTTSYAQAAALNPDGSHGPIQCGACHEVDNNGVPTWLRSSSRWPGGQIGNSIDAAITWAHTYTDEQSVLDSTCQNCHGVKGNNWDEVISENDAYIDHNDPQSQNKHMPRGMMDKAEIAVNGGVVFGFNPDGSANVQQRNDVCSGCHGNRLGDQSCDDTWRRHLTDGFVSEVLWVDLSTVQADGSACGW